MKLFLVVWCDNCTMTITTALSLIDLNSHFIQQGISCIIELVGSHTPNFSRSEMVRRALRHSDDNAYVAFVNHDIAFRPSTFARLLDDSLPPIRCGLPPAEHPTIDWSRVVSSFESTAAESIAQAGLRYDFGSAGTIKDGFVHRAKHIVPELMVVQRAFLQKMSDSFGQEGLFQPVDDSIPPTFDEAEAFAMRALAVDNDSIAIDIASIIVRVGTLVIP